MRDFLRITACFLLLLALANMTSANSLRWIPVESRKTVDLSQVLTTPDGKEVSLAELKGRVLFLNFWATWCSPCREEMPLIQKLQERLTSNGLEVTVAAVSDDDARAVRKFLERNGYTFPFLIDAEGDMAAESGVMTLPTTLIVDSQSRVALAHIGIYSWDEAEVLEGLRRLAAE